MSLGRHHHGGGGRGGWGGSWGGGGWGWDGPTIYSPTIVEPVFLPYPFPGDAANMQTTDEYGVLPSPVPGPDFGGGNMYLNAFGATPTSEGSKDLIVMAVIGGLIGSAMVAQGHQMKAMLGAGAGAVGGLVLASILRRFG